MSAIVPDELLPTVMATISSTLIVTTSGAVTTLTLNRPEKRNALNGELLQLLAEAIAVAGSDSTQRILVLRGAGKVFCSGMDLKEGASAENAAKAIEQIHTVLHLLATTRLVTIALVQGAAVAGGAGLMSACDFVIATRDAKFGFPEVRRGLVPALIMTFIRRQLRERDARELLLLGKLIPSEHALAIGLVSRVVAQESAFDTEAATLISSVLQGGPETLAATKQLLNELWPSSFAADFARADAVHLATRTASEAAEGIAAFNEKRAPKWAP